jgi:putative Mg2+ transporter-C (MgtC) family protein
MEINIEIELIKKFLLITGVSILCGILIGLEREVKHKPAGLKTITLVTVGSTIFTFISKYGFSGSEADGSRVAAQIVNGIGFLGAGTIIRSGLKIKGLTTAATLWIAASIGMVIGAERILEGILGSLIIFFSIIILRAIEKLLYENLDTFYIKVKYNLESNQGKIDHNSILNELKNKLNEINIEILETTEIKDSIILKLKGSKNKVKTELNEKLKSEHYNIKLYESKEF